MINRSTKPGVCARHYQIMKNNSPEKKLLTLFSQFTGKKEGDFLIEKIKTDSITVRETEKGGELEVHFKGGDYTRFSKEILEMDILNAVINPRVRDIIGKKCDGIFIARVNGKFILCLVELKKNINNSFEKVVKQIEGSYIKIAMLLNLLYDLQYIDLVVFIGGGLKKITDEPDIDYLEKIDVFRERGDNLESKLKEFSQNKRVRMNFPYFLGDIIHQHFQKRNIVVYHLEHGDTTIFLF